LAKDTPKKEQHYSTGDSVEEAPRVEDESIETIETIETLEIPESNISEELIDTSEGHNFLTLTSTARVISSSSEWGSDFLAQEAEKLSLQKQPDLMYIEHKLVHANVNKNRDEFKLEELKIAEKSPVLKLVNWEHSEENIGTIFASKLIDSPENEDEDPYLLVGVAISKAKFPLKAREIQERHLKNELYFSMETYFKRAECSTCGSNFSEGPDTYCEHLQDRLSLGSSTSRILRGLTFAGDAIVKGKKKKKKKKKKKHLSTKKRK